jgi:hypothetical protein
MNGSEIMYFVSGQSPNACRSEKPYIRLFARATLAASRCLHSTLFVRSRLNVVVERALPSLCYSWRHPSDARVQPKDCIDGEQEPSSSERKIADTVGLRVCGGRRLRGCPWGRCGLQVASATLFLPSGAHFRTCETSSPSRRKTSH